MRRVEIQEREARLAAKLPSAVTMAQARVVLEAAGLAQNIDAAIKGAGKPAQIAWEYATELHRDSPTLLALAKQLHLSDEQLDALFLQAKDVKF